MKLWTRRNWNLFSGKYWMLRQMSKISQLRVFSVETYWKWHGLNTCALSLYRCYRGCLPLNRIWSIWLWDNQLAVFHRLQLDYPGTFHWIDETCSTTAWEFLDTQFHERLHNDIPCTRFRLAFFVLTEHSQSEIKSHTIQLRSRLETSMYASSYHYHPKVNFWLEK